MIWVGEAFKEGAETLIERRWKKHVIKGGGGFTDWDGYMEFFHTKLAGNTIFL